MPQPHVAGEYVLALWCCDQPGINATVTVYISAPWHRAAMEFLSPASSMTTPSSSDPLVVYDRNVLPIRIALPYQLRAAAAAVGQIQWELQLWQHGVIKQLFDRDGYYYHTYLS